MEKKRSDADQPKEPKRSNRKYVIAASVIMAIIIVLIVLYFRFPQLFEWIKI